MPERDRKRIDKGVYLVNGIVYFERTKDGKLIRRKAPIQYSAAVSARGTMTADLRRAYREFCDHIENEEWRSVTRSRSDSVTVERLIEVYRASAEKECAVRGSPRPGTVQQNVSQLMALCRETGADRLDALDRRNVEAWLAKRCQEAPAASGAADRARVTAWSTLNQARGLWARWTAPYYEDARISLPECLRGWPAMNTAATSAAYERPPEELRKRTLEWYAAQKETRGDLWVAVTLMLQMGMRPVDAAALSWDDFETARDGTKILAYVPSKTRGRTERLRGVRWPVSPEMFADLRQRGGPHHVIPRDSPGTRMEIYLHEVNPALRAIGWHRDRWSKACYELRKMCVDTVYHRLGLERAVQISGDNPDTVRKFYSDPNCDKVKPFDVTAE